MKKFLIWGGLLAVVGFCVWAYYAPRSALLGLPEASYLDQLLRKKTPVEVEAELGKPDDVKEESTTMAWTYNKAARNRDTNEEFAVIVLFDMLEKPPRVKAVASQSLGRPKWGK